jgi:hypothetical protein
MNFHFSLPGHIKEEYAPRDAYSSMAEAKGFEPRMPVHGLAPSLLCGLYAAL